MSNCIKAEYPQALKQCTVIYPMHLVDSKAINEGYNGVFRALNRLVECKNKESISSKVCCICDRFIQYGDDKQLPLKWLLHTCAHRYFHKDKIDWGNSGVKFVSREVKNRVLQQYTQHCTRRNVTIDGVLVNFKQIVLSPRTYGIDCSKTGKLSFFGCCNECYVAIKKMKSKNDKAPEVPKFASVNG